MNLIAIAETGQVVDYNVGATRNEAEEWLRKQSMNGHVIFARFEFCLESNLVPELHEVDMTGEIERTDPKNQPAQENPPEVAQ